MLASPALGNINPFKGFDQRSSAGHTVYYAVSILFAKNYFDSVVFQAMFLICKKDVPS
jgi:hypothetical protein